MEAMVEAEREFLKPRKIAVRFFWTGKYWDKITFERLGMNQESSERESLPELKD